jgi:DNA polymerase-3 subunit beta
MEFIIERSELLAGLYLAQGIVERRTTVPILSHILFASDGNTVTVAATDQEIGVRRQCQAKVKKKGMISASARKLYEMAREFPEGEVTIRGKENNWIEVIAGKAKFRLVGLDPRDFPEMTQAPDDTSLSIQVKAPVLSDMIEHTIFAISVDETRANLNGIFLECIEPGKLRMVATDGHRLAMVTEEVSGGQTSKGVIVPRKAVGELRKVLEGGEEDIEILVAEGVSFARRGAVEMSMRLIEGEFPDYNQVIPEKSARVCYVDVANLTAALRRISTVSSERTKGVRIQLEKGRMELSTINPDVGEGTEELEVEYTGDGVGIGFNARYLLDALNSFPADGRVEIGLTDEVSPGVIRLADSASYCYIVMPMRL